MAITAILTAAVCALATWVACLGWRRLLVSREIFDIPGTRSSHTVPTPSGAGLVMMAVLLVVWVLWHHDVMDKREAFFLMGAVLVCGVSTLDDFRPLSWTRRLLVHCAAVGMALPFVFHQGWVSQGLLPPTIEPAVLLVVWVAFTNFYNFMDGMDGMTVMQTVCIAVGLVVVGMLTENLWLHPLAALMGVMLGFGVWNRAPARLFMGDGGAIPLGFILGGLLLHLAAQGFWQVALILPLYYLADAGLTVLRRLFLGRRIWEAHREHFFQRPLQAGRSHGWVLRRVAPVMVLLVVLGVLSLWWLWLALVGSGLLVLVLLVVLSLEHSAEPRG